MATSRARRLKRKAKARRATEGDDRRSSPSLEQNQVEKPTKPENPLSSLPREGLRRSRRLLKLDPIEEPKPTFPLLSLPKEIRNIIYEFMVAKTYVFGGSVQARGQSRDSYAEVINLLLVSRQFSEEVWQVLVLKSTWFFKSVRSCMGIFLAGRLRPYSVTRIGFSLPSWVSFVRYPKVEELDILGTILPYFTRLQYLDITLWSPIGSYLERRWQISPRHIEMIYKRITLEYLRELLRFAQKVLSENNRLTVLVLQATESPGDVSARLQTARATVCASRKDQILDPEVALQRLESITIFQFPDQIKHQVDGSVSYYFDMS